MAMKADVRVKSDTVNVSLRGDHLRTTSDTVGTNRRISISRINPVSVKV